MLNKKSSYKKTVDGGANAGAEDHEQEAAQGRPLTVQGYRGKGPGIIRQAGKRLRYTKHDGIWTWWNKKNILRNFLEIYTSSRAIA